MKILVVSLLRVGDVLLALPLFAALKRAHPEAEIHLLCNDSAGGLQPLLPDIHFHLFERKEIQQGLGEYQRPFFDSYYLVKELITELSALKFDRVINLTQNRLSGYICGAITATDKAGLVMSRNGSASFGSTWFSYLNDYVAAGGKEVFHYSDIFSYGTGYTPPNEVNLPEVATGVAEAERILGNSAGPVILIQALTSDEKKNWSLKLWAEALGLLQLKFPATRFLLLGAPFEEDRLTQLREAVLTAGVRAELAICSLPGALSLLRRADLLLTGDTSIKHLASVTNIPVVELCLGSSDFRKTGIYRKGNVIVQSKVPCAPCSHLSACEQAQHLCAERLSPAAVALVATSCLTRDWNSLKVVAEEFGPEIEIFRTQFSQSGYWLAEPVVGTNATATVKRHLEKSTWKLMLEREHLRPLGEFGSEARRLKEMVGQGLNPLKDSVLRECLRQLESEARLTESRAVELIRKGRQLGSQHEARAALRDLTEMLHQECERDDSNRLLLSYLASFQAHGPTGVPDLSRLRQVMKILEDVKCKSAIRMKLIRSMQSQAMEKV